MRFDYAICVLAILNLPGCGGAPIDATPTSPAQVLPQAPTVELLQPAPDTITYPETSLALKVIVTDSDSTMDEIALTLFSSLDGLIAEGSPNDEGIFESEFSLATLGPHLLMVEATDASGEQGSAEVYVTVDPLPGPDLYVADLPDPIYQGDSLQVEGTVDPAVGVALESYTVSLLLDSATVDSAPLLSSGAFLVVTPPLEAGAHTLLISVEDTQGHGDTAYFEFSALACADFDGDGARACGEMPDCDDKDPQVYPNAEEICGNDTDDNCDGHSDEGFPDEDGDGLPDCIDLCPADALNDQDADGICRAEDNCPEVSNPEQIDVDQDGIGDACDDEISEICDGLDNDEDGQVDEDFATDSDDDDIIDCLDACPEDAQNDQDGDGICADEDNCPAQANPDQHDEDGDDIGDLCDVEDCDGVDNNGDGEIDEGFDLDGDGYVNCTLGEEMADCDDDDPLTYPGPEEICDDGGDNNCDGWVDIWEDAWEPNNKISDAAYLGNINDSEQELFASIFSADGIDTSDFYAFDLEDDFAYGVDQFQITVELSDIPEGLNLSLILYYGTSVVAQSDTPGSTDQTLTVYGVGGVDNAEQAYMVEVRYVGGSGFESCSPYRLWIYNYG